MADLALINKIFQDVQSKDPGWIDRITAKQTKLLAAEYKKAYLAIDAQIAALYRKLGELSYGEMVKYDRLVKLNQEIYAELAKSNIVIKKIIYEDIKLEYKEAYQRKGYGLEKSLEIDIGFTQLAPAQIEASLYKQYNFRTIDPTLKSQTAKINVAVQHNITQGLIQGHGYGEMTKGVKESFKRGFNDAYRIMRTEGHRAREIGNMDAGDFATSKGVIKIDIWSAVFDSRTRINHGDMDGTERETDGYFHLPGGVIALAPGLSGDPAEDINCRCSVTYKILGLESNLKRVQGIGIVTKEVAYQAWKDMKEIDD